MALFDFQINLDQAVAQLTRIADALDRLNPPPPLDRLATTRKREKSGIVNYGDNTKTWLSESITNIIHPQGLAPAQEQELLDKMLHHYQPEPDEDQQP